MFIPQDYLLVKNIDIVITHCSLSSNQRPHMFNLHPTWKFNLHPHIQDSYMVLKRLAFPAEHYYTNTAF